MEGVRQSPEKGYGVEVRLEGPCSSVLRLCDGSLTLTLPDSLSSTAVTTNALYPA